VVVRQPGTTVSTEQMLDFLRNKLHKISMPDDVVFVEELPHTATGKLNKLALRKTFEDYQFPTQA
jgi:fatty-acyl-CoA synthase